MFFLFCFLPLSVLFSFFERSAEYKNFILIIFSVLFFAWGRPFIVCLLFVSVIFDWLLGMLCGSQKPKALRIGALVLDLMMNAALFVWLGRNYLFEGALSLSRELIPIGVTFYTLRAFSYVLDCFCKRIPAEKNIFCFMTYMISFPLMTAGPIVRYGDISKQIREREVNGKLIAEGMERIIIGAAKLTVAAPILAEVAAAGLDSGEVTISGSWIGMAAYILRLCIVWSGACDISVGCGRLFGFVYPESFSFIKMDGYVSGIAKSFNSTLNTLFDDAVVKPVNEKSKLAGYLAMILCGAMIGMWYHSGLFYAAAGAAAAIFIILETLFLKKFFDEHIAVISWVYTLAVLFALFSLTKFGSFAELKTWAAGLIGKGEPYILSVALKDVLLKYIFALAALTLIYLPPVRYLCKKTVTELSQRSAVWYGTFRLLRTAAMCFLLFLTATALTASLII